MLCLAGRPQIHTESQKFLCGRHSHSFTTRDAHTPPQTEQTAVHVRLSPPSRALSRTPPAPGGRPLARSSRVRGYRVWIKIKVKVLPKMMVLPGGSAFSALVGAAAEGMRKTQSADAMHKEEVRITPQPSDDDGHLSDSAMAPTRERKKGESWSPTPSLGLDKESFSRCSVERRSPPPRRRRRVPPTSPPYLPAPPARVYGVVQSSDVLPPSCVPTRPIAGVPWTEEEHRLFLLGLQKLGKVRARFAVPKSFRFSPPFECAPPRPPPRTDVHHALGRTRVAASAHRSRCCRVQHFQRRTARGLGGNGLPTRRV
jgi:hypothetical protein